MDGGTEVKGAFDSICDKQRIRRTTVPPNSPQFNDYAERGIATLEATVFVSRLQAKDLF